MKQPDGMTKHSVSQFARELNRKNSEFHKEVPSVKETQHWTREMVGLLFPLKENRSPEPGELESELNSMQERLTQLLEALASTLERPAKEITDEFFLQLPAVYHALLDDARTFLGSDPASENLEEVILCYPGFFTLVVFRMANILWKMNVPVLPRVMTEYAHSKTGIDIHPGAEIGKNCFIDHGTGIVIGETTKVGNNVKIYQGVTLGALYVKKDMSNTKRHPTVEDNVILYGGCTILGGKTVVGHDTIIGGNVWLTESVPPECIVYRENKIRVREKDLQTNTWNYII